MIDDVQATVDSFSYDGYGMMLGGNPTAPAATNLLYTGEHYDTDASSYYLRARWYDPSNGRFNRVDPYAGNMQDPQSLHKYLYCHANPVNGTDPSGMFWGGLCIAIAIGAIVMSIVQVGVNYITNRPLFENVGWAALFGMFAAPLALLFPIFGAMLAFAGLVMALMISIPVLLNKNSTMGQKGVAVLLILFAAFGCFRSVGYARSPSHNGWINPNAFSPKTPPAIPLQQGSKLCDLFPGVSDEAYIHWTPQSPEVMAGGVRPNNYWWRFGDVKNLSLKQLRGIIGDMAAGGQDNANTFVISENPNLFKPTGPPANWLNVVEYQNTSTVAPDAVGVVSSGGPGS